MCRLSAFFGAPICAADLVTRPSRSIITQSFDARERMSGDASTPAYLNGDGFGLGWYSASPDDFTPCVYKQARPAWNERNLSSIAEKVTTPVLFAHVRAASPGLDVSESTCHPFRFGRYLWMHNGGIANFHRIRFPLMSALSEPARNFALDHGSSDSALCFAVFLSLVRDPMAPSTPDELRRRLEETICILRKAILAEDTEELSLLNFVVSDGDSLAASRYVIHPKNPHPRAASLYYACGNSYQPDPNCPGSYSMLHTQRHPTLAIISSEPLTEERSDWVSVPQNHLIVVTAALHIVIAPVESADNPCVSQALENLMEPLPLMDPVASKIFTSKSSILSLDNSLQCKHPSLAQANAAINAPDAEEARFAISVPERAFLSLAVVDNFLCAGAEDGSIYVCDLNYSEVLEPVRDAHGAVLALHGDSDRRLLISAYSASSVCLWYVPNNGKLQRLLSLPFNGMGDVLSLALVGRSIFAGFSDTCARCVVPDVDVIREFSHSESIRRNAADLRNLRDQLLSVSSELSGELDSTSDFSESKSNSRFCAQPCPKEPINRPASANDRTSHFGFVFAVSSCTEGSLICTGCGDGIVRAWDKSSGKCVYRRHGHGGAVLALASLKTRRGSLLFSGSCDRTIKVWDIDSGFICKRTLRKHRGEIVFLAITDGKLFSGSADGITHVWCTESLRHLGQYRDIRLLAGAVSERYKLVFTATSNGVIYARDMLKVKRKEDKKQTRNTPRTPILHSTGLSTNLATSKRSSATRSPRLGSAVMTLPIRSKSTDFPELALDDDTTDDDASTLVYGLDNELVVAPQSPSIRFSSSHALRLSKRAMAQSLETEQSFLDKHKLSTAEKPEIENEISLTSGDERNVDVNGKQPGRGNGSNCFNRDRPGSSGSSDDGVYVEVGEQELKHERAADKKMAVDSIRLTEERLLQDVLARFVSFATVSGLEEYREDCWQGARYVGNLLELLGASVKYVPTSSTKVSPIKSSHDTLSAKNSSAASLETPSTNPIVLARFASTHENAQTVAFYGHYDVMPADSAKWASDPWKLTAINGRYYGRGVTDNKGPILAMIFAIKSILNKAQDCLHTLHTNIVLILEGEGETSNHGFRDCIDSHKHWLQDTVLILTSNSYWLGESWPCITYGMRGVIDLQVTVSGPSRNLHSGVDGGAVIEPVSDLLAVTSTLVDASGASRVSGFHDDVRPLSAEDEKHLEDIEFNLEEYQQRIGTPRFVTGNASRLLKVRWRQPSISVTSLETSNTTGLYSVVPREATAKLSIRFVPDQDPKKIKDAVCTHLESELRKRNSPNTLSVTCVNQGDWWLGDPSCEHFQIAANAIRSVWGVEPKYVCEGGTMPIFSFLSKVLDAPIVQVPLGQSSDGAHLPNERIRAINLHKGKQVLELILEKLVLYGNT